MKVRVEGTITVMPDGKVMIQMFEIEGNAIDLKRHCVARLRAAADQIEAAADIDQPK